MKFTGVILALAATAVALPHTPSKPAPKPVPKPVNGRTCNNEQTVICKGVSGNGGLINLGNLLAGLLGDNCSGGDVYCCDRDEVNQVGLINLDLNLQCVLNRVL